MKTKHSDINSQVTVRRGRRTRTVSVERSTLPFRNPEEAFAATKTLEDRRALGQFFTPEPIALMMADWICGINPGVILDPAVGPGAFPRAIAQRLSVPASMVCVDIDPAVINFVNEIDLASCGVMIENRLGDFLTMKFDEKFDGIIANPPYLRHHAMSYDFDIFSLIGGAAKINISRLANSYILFLLRCITLLKSGGRMCFIIPAEWTNANFGQPVKECLLDRGFLRQMAYFNHAADIFADTLTTSCVLFIEKDTLPASNIVPIHYVTATTPLNSLSSVEALAKNVPAIEVPKAALRATKKWDALIRGRATSPLPGFIRLGDIAATKRGIATGANDFFHLTKCEVDVAGISDQNLLPCVERAADVVGLMFTNADYDRLSCSGGRAHLVAFGREMNLDELQYIREGMARGLQDRYLLSMRSPWYSVESGRLLLFGQPYSIENDLDSFTIRLASTISRPFMASFRMP